MYNFEVLYNIETKSKLKNMYILHLPVYFRIECRYFYMVLTTKLYVNW